MVQEAAVGSEGRVTQKGSAAEERAVLWPWGEAEARPPWAALGVLMALAAVLRGIALNQQLWYDEITTLVEFVRQPLGYIVTTYTTQNQHMLYSVLARISVVMFGEAAWTLRLPAVVFGVATVPALYFCARLMATRREALLACALLAVSYHHVWFSQNARGYTGLAFFTLVTTYFFVRGMRGGKGAGLKAAPTGAGQTADLALKQAGWANWVWYGVTLALGMYTHLTMGFVAVGQALVYLWLVVARRRELGRWPENAWTPAVGFVLAGALAAALYAPVMGQMLERTVGGSTGRGAVEVVKAEWRNPLWLVLETMRGLGAGSAAVGFAAATLGGLIVLAGLWSYWRQNRYAAGLMVLPGIVTGAAMLALSRNLWPRFFFFAIGFGLLLIVRGAMEWAGVAARMMKREASGAALPVGGDESRTARNGCATERWGTAAVALMLLASCWQVRAAHIYPKQDFVGAMEFVEAQKKPGDAVALVGLTQVPYQKYYGRDWPAVSSRAELEAASRSAGPGRAAWVLYTLPVYVRSRYPDLWSTLESECTQERVFRGTMGGGEIYVCKVEK